MTTVPERDRVDDHVRRLLDQLDQLETVMQSVKEAAHRLIADAEHDRH